VAATNAEWLTTTPIAHRGLHDEEYPENSLPAFVAAANSGFALELDLHMSSDGRLVVFHDADLKRMTGQGGFVADVQAAALTQLRLSGTEYVIPLFEEVLELVEGKAPILAEIKAGSSMTRVGPVLRTLIAGYGGPVAVQSFDPRVLLWLKKHAPHVVRGQISGSFEGEQLCPAQEFLLRSMLLNVLSRPDFLAFDLRAMPSASVSAWRIILDAPLLLWTIRTPEELVEARKYGANVIFEAMRPVV
jgi:glycerophosphoryl diester phosphodiesterase